MYIYFMYLLPVCRTAQTEITCDQPPGLCASFAAHAAALVVAGMQTCCMRAKVAPVAAAVDYRGRATGV